MQELHLKELFKKYIANTCSEEEIRRYYGYFNTEEEFKVRKLIREQLESNVEIEDEVEKAFLVQTTEEVYEEIQRKLNSNPILGGSSSFKKLWIRMSTVAAILLFLTFGTYYFIYRDDTKELHHDLSRQIVDLPPGTNSATLTLGDGKHIDLKSSEGGIRIEGEIRYSDGEVISAATAGRLKLSVPRGGTYQVTLEDGTSVWLNSDSELIYPAHFSTDSRWVELRGEAYFEVSKDQSRPFYVSSAGQEVKVLGTEFNINTYPENSNSYTTLVEGKVQVHNTKVNQYKTLLPGHQGVVGSRTTKVSKVDVAPLIAWKTGQFNFENKSLEQIMAEFARWYDIEVRYETSIPDISLYGDINRDVNLSFALQILESAGVRYKLDGKILTILGKDK